ncbi:bifunctional DNA-formamidopyrimidine glycosylase/DNA-(apurinic or apyrimidinic site) lyase [Ancylobacter terrae]|uniref:bifunctional DNA-formamidopyrimidine glycosylase/DNA-(apurinic or apyrimidinic site) lyase n=1 Tax=Ancylobacter sp. sgz301288 TaxID=3342077 RepID=UPI00385CA415
MPELPEVETVRRGLSPAMEGAVILAAEARRPDLRWPLPDRFAERLAGRRIVSLARRAKYLLADLDATEGQDAEVLVMHLGMSGSFRLERPGESLAPGAFALPRSKAAAHDHVVLRLGNGFDVVYNDPRRFGAMLLVPRTQLEIHPLFRNLGPEPLGNAFDAAHLARACAGRTTSLKAALLDQKIVAGLGNIYVSEALHRAGLSPHRAAGTLAQQTGAPSARATRLVAAIRTVLDEAIAAGGSTLRDHAQVDGELGYFQHAFRVYDRADSPCPTPGCQGIILRTVQAGRSTFHCSTCQR